MQTCEIVQCLGGINKLLEMGYRKVGYGSNRIGCMKWDNKGVCYNLQYFIFQVVCHTYYFTFLFLRRVSVFSAHNGLKA